MILNKQQKKDLIRLDEFCGDLEDQFYAGWLDNIAAAAKESTFITELDPAVVIEYYQLPGRNHTEVHAKIYEFWANIPLKR